MLRPSRIVFCFPVMVLAAAGCSYFFPSCQTTPGCPDAQVLCNNLTCSDLRTDDYNCGFCNNVCGSGLACTGLTDGGFACGCLVPGTILADGKCVDLRIDPRNCGGAGNPCRLDQVCNGGTCGCLGQSDAGITECPEDAGPRCTNLNTDPANCGQCGQPCALTCASGVCVDGGPADAGEDAGPADAGDDAGPGDAGDDAGADGGTDGG